MPACGTWVDPDGGLPLCDSDLDPDHVDLAIQVATELMWEASGRRFRGVCSDTIHPFEDGVCWWFSRVPWRVRPMGDCCGTGLGCWCSGSIHGAVALPNLPVVSVDEVVVGGEPLDPDDWQVVDGRWLVRVGGHWPPGPGGCDSSIDPDRFRVTYRWGSPPPATGRLAVQLLACEFARGWTPGKSCRLPKRVTQISREGVSMTIMDQFSDLLDSGFGIPEVAAFVQTYRARPAGRLLAPHVQPGRARRITG